MSVGAWTVDVAGNRLSDADETIELEPRVMDLLVLFADRAGEVISKDEIATALWGQVHVNDDALTRCIFKLRKALKDDARQPTYIETVSKRGYRLIADVSRDDPSDGTKPQTRRFAWIAAAAVLILLIRFPALSLAILN